MSPEAKMKSKNKNLQIFTLGIAVILIDRITKIIFSDIVYVNTGGLFGILKGYNSIFIILSLIFIILLAYYFTISKFSRKIFLTIIISGLLSNLIDRIIYGYMIDFIDLKIWPVFNLADFFITLGTILLIVSILKGNK